MQPISATPSSLSQPIPLDMNGDMKIDLLGLLSDDLTHPKVWQNVWNASEPSGPLYNVYASYKLTPSLRETDRTTTRIDAPLPGARCRISNPHSNAVVDLNGDCLAGMYFN
jgi:integrin alpha FG-GAP repeat containing protein 1